MGRNQFAHSGVQDRSMIDTLASITAELEIRLVPVSKQREPMETCAVNILARILREHGAGHLRSVLISIVETKHNKRNLIAPIILAMSDLLLAHPAWFGADFLQAMDDIDLSDLHEKAKANRAAAQPRQAIATMLYQRMSDVFEPEEQARLI